MGYLMTLNDVERDSQISGIESESESESVSVSDIVCNIIST